MEKVSFPICVNYADVVESAKSFLFRMAFVEYHPEMLNVEEVQAVEGKLLRLSDNAVYNEYAAQVADLDVIKRIFYELLTDVHKTSDWRNAEPSLYYDESRIVARLRKENRSERYIDFFCGQLYKVQQTIMERTECIREMVRGWECPGSDRVINETELKKFFSSHFFGGGMNSNRWALDYLPSIRKQRKDIDMARIAYMTYKSKFVSPKMKPATFREFYKNFCHLVGCGYHSEYKPSKLGATEELRREFSYLCT